jgi:hypothetical protein
MSVQASTASGSSPVVASIFCEGTHFVEVDPDGTTKECAQCGVETDKQLWVLTIPESGSSWFPI